MKLPKLPAVATAAALMLALSGCSFTSGDDSSSDGNSSSNHSESSEDNSEDASDAGVAKIDPDDVVVSQKVKVPGSPGDTATIAIHSLTVDGKVQKLQLVITPHFKSVSDSEAISVFDVWGENSFAPQLIDMDHLKIYSVIGESASKDWTSDVLYTETTNGTPMVAWAMFAAPEDDVDSFDVRLLDSWPQFTDVPVTR